jgi:hypothetical protein
MIFSFEKLKNEKVHELEALQEHLQTKTVKSDPKMFPKNAVSIREIKKVSTKFH